MNCKKLLSLGALLFFSLGLEAITLPGIATQNALQTAQEANITLRSLGADVLTVAQTQQLDVFIFRLQNLIQSTLTAMDPVALLAEANVAVMLDTATNYIVSGNNIAANAASLLLQKISSTTAAADKATVLQQVAVYKAIANGLNLSQGAINIARQSLALALSPVDATTLAQQQTYSQIQPGILAAGVATLSLAKGAK